MVIKTVKFYLVLFVIGWSTACTNPTEAISSKVENKDSTNDPLNNKDLVDSLLYEALENRNFKAYDKLYSSYLWKYRDRELLYYSFVMANKHNYPQAYFNVFHSLTFPNHDSLGIKSLDNTTRSIALYYLLKSYELGHKDSKYTIEKIFGADKEVPKSYEYLVLNNP